MLVSPDTTGIEPQGQLYSLLGFTLANAAFPFFSIAMKASARLEARNAASRSWETKVVRTTPGTEGQRLQFCFCFDVLRIAFTYPLLRERSLCIRVSSLA